MKVQELLEDLDRLDEITLKQALAAGTIGAAAAASMFSPPQKPPEATQTVVGKISSQPAETLALGIARRYRIALDDAFKIVKTAEANADPVFPKRDDLLAVIGIESSFNPTKKSPLRRDPAIGLMQVRPGVWNIKRKNLKTVDAQIATGAAILSQYYSKLGDKDAALNAYNVGITAHRRGVQNTRYVQKFHTERHLLTLPVK
jgi:soluble lytic murein transglycosylase-like protein